MMSHDKHTHARCQNRLKALAKACHCFVVICCACVQVLTEGDAFTMAFHDPIDAIAWALDVQHRLLLLPWPAELLTQADAKEMYSPPFMPIRRLMFKGLRVRMAMHTGKPEAIQVCHGYAWKLLL